MPCKPRQDIAKKEPSLDSNFRTLRSDFGDEILLLWEVSNEGSQGGIPALVAECTDELRHEKVELVSTTPEADQRVASGIRTPCKASDNATNTSLHIRSCIGAHR